jgi:hypothetical protein
MRFKTAGDVGFPSPDGRENPFLSRFFFGTKKIGTPNSYRVQEIAPNKTTKFSILLLIFALNKIEL